MKTSLLVLSAALLVASSAHADPLTLIFTDASQSASSPGVLSYTGTITASPSINTPIDLNGDAFTLIGPYTLDDSAFADSPATLGAGQSYTGVLFTIPLTNPLTDGTFNGTFSLLGGGDPESKDVLTTQRFSLTVAPGTPTSVTPEPSSLLLFLSGAGMVTTVARRRTQPSTSGEDALTRG